MNLPEKNVLTLEAAQRILDGARTEAAGNGWCVSIAIVDDGGHLLLFARMDGVHAGTIEVAVAKARTAILFRKPTRDFADALAAGKTALLALPAMLPFPGGIPLTFGSGFVGAIGVSGAAPEVDERLALAGAGVLTR